MRALPGRASRTALDAPTTLTRESVESAQRQRILRATGELVAKRGYNDVTVELIVKRARVSFKTFYKHFAGKEECFLELFDSAFALANREIREALADDSGPWPQQVATALRALAELILADPLIARACIVEAPTAGPIVLARYQQASRALAPLFRRGRELNPRAAQLPATIEDTLAGSVLWSAYQRLVVGEVGGLEALLPELVELVLRPYLGEREAAQIARDVAEAQPA